MKKLTAKTPEQVMWFVETINHDFASTLEEGFLVIRGSTHQLRIPKAVEKQCFLKVSEGPYDARMFRWDHAAAVRKSGWKLYD